MVAKKKTLEERKAIFGMKGRSWALWTNQPRRRKKKLEEEAVRPACFPGWERPEDRARLVGAAVAGKNFWEREAAWLKIRAERTEKDLVQKRDRVRKEDEEEEKRKAKLR